MAALAMEGRVSQRDIPRGRWEAGPYLSLLKPRISLLVVMSALAGALAAGSGSLSLTTLFPLAAALFLASAGASALNHYLERDIDGLMERTRLRPLPAGRVRNPKMVLAGGFALIFLSLCLSSFALNLRVALNLLLGAFVYVVLYTLWLKRRSPLNIVIGGLAGSFAVLAGGASEASGLSAGVLCLSLVLFLWTPSHFWSLAILRREDYARAGVPMLPVLVGDKKAALYILVNSALLFLSSLLPYSLSAQGGIYLFLALPAGCFFLARNLQLFLNPTGPLAQKNFMASMVYLLIILLGVSLDSTL